MTRCNEERRERGEAFFSQTCRECGTGGCTRKLRPILVAGRSLALLTSIAGRKVYIAGPMRGIPEFNFPAFNDAADALRKIGCHVFNPAEKDNERHGTDISKGNARGDEAQATKDHGFNLREALALDLEFICREADVVALLPGWERSKGANAERATADALGLEIILL